ncbi:MAG: hypothetical protein FWE20_11630 [Defluviitaleaceae bacterium]|nr:hypothetical protein [Defluviitaleaceae bacterium]
MDLVGAFAQIGRNSGEAAGKITEMTRSVSGAVEGLSRLVDYTENTAQKIGTMTYEARLSGQGFLEWEPLIGRISEEMGSLRENAYNFAGALADTYEAAKNFGGSLDEVEQIVGGLKQGFDEQLVPALDGGLEAFHGLIEGAEAVRDQVQSALGDVVTKAGELAELSPLFEPLNRGVQTLAEGFDKVMEAVSPIENALVVYETAVKAVDAAKGLAEKGFAAYEKAMNTITTAKNLAAKAQGALNLAMKSNPIGLVVGALALLVAGITYLWKTNEDFRESVTKAWDALKSLAGDVIGAIKEFFSEADEIGRNLINGLWNGITGAASWLKERISGLFNEVIGTVKRIFGIRSPSTVFADIGRNAIQGMINGVTELAGRVKDSVRNVADGVLNAASSILSGMTDIGRSLMEGLAGGIAGAASSVANAAMNAAQSAVNAVKSFLGVNSPSKVFVKIGNSVGEGFVNGIRSMSSAVDRVMNDTFGNIDRGINTGRSVRGLTPSASPVFNFHINADIGGEHDEDSLRRIARKLANYTDREMRGRGVAFA